MKLGFMLLAAMLPLGVSSAATWNILNDESRVSFVTVKQGNFAEVNHFTAVEGTLTDSGKFSLDIPLIGVQTNIGIRNERMQSMLFEIAKYPLLELSATVDMKVINAIAPGRQALVTVDASVAMHGRNQPMAFTVMVSRLNKDTMTVSSYQPVIVNASVFGLAAGVEKLREAAGLQAISEAVPVSFVITLKQHP
ncbi:MAG: YceI family protein [Shewanella sp.]|nr:YceI family protein [Shewanella sp.]MCF1430826.1 YceI family protein [Shewanella sp.]MCF1439002.1 YceI family protein [Shewanella sp.]MCF1458032.1 YceI family protein [Shewanella sp.]